MTRAPTQDERLAALRELGVPAEMLGQLSPIGLARLDVFAERLSEHRGAKRTVLRQIAADAHAQADRNDVERARALAELEG